MIHSRKDYQERIIDKEGKIPEDMPVFLMLASDVFFIDTLRDYALNLISAGLDNMADDVFDHIKKVQKYQKKHLPKLPTVPGIKEIKDNDL